MSADANEVQVVEIPYLSGAVHFRYGRYLSADGKRWLRHGPFREYYESGALAGEGEYRDGLEQGLWRDYHENGRLAAEGYYVDGCEEGVWQFWSAGGREEEAVVYRDGVEVGPG